MCSSSSGDWTSHRPDAMQDTVRQVAGPGTHRKTSQKPPPRGFIYHYKHIAIAVPTPFLHAGAPRSPGSCSAPRSQREKARHCNCALEGLCFQACTLFDGRSFHLPTATWAIAWSQLPPALQYTLGVLNEERECPKRLVFSCLRVFETSARATPKDASMVPEAHAAGHSTEWVRWRPRAIQALQRPAGSSIWRATNPCTRPQDSACRRLRVLPLFGPCCCRA